MGENMEPDIKFICDTIRQTAYDVHVRFMPGYLEKVYENTLSHRLSKLGLSVRQQAPIVVRDEDDFVVGEYCADLLVEDIAGNLNFVTPNYFVSSFYHQYRLTPKDYRNSNDL